LHLQKSVYSQKENLSYESNDYGILITTTKKNHCLKSIMTFIVLRGFVVDAYYFALFMLHIDNIDMRGGGGIIEIIFCTILFREAIKIENLVKSGIKKWKFSNYFVEIL
jgi:hypothetical protein